MNKLKIGVLIFFVTLVLTGCREDLFKAGDTEQIVRFRCDSVSTRSAGFTQSGQDAIISMGVYASHTTGAWTVSDAINLMRNHNVERADSNSPWEYTPDIYWPGNGNVSFFAYAPYNAAGASLSGSNGIPNIDFNVNNNYANQVDLLVATPQIDKTKTSSAGGYVNFILRHALSRITFAAKTASTDNVTITNIKLDKLYGTGSCAMDGRALNWTAAGNADKSYTLSESNGLEAGKTLTNEYITITSADGNLFVLPQTLSTDANVVISYSINGVPEATPITINLANVLAQWQSGEAIRFLINISTNNPIDSQLTYTFAAWGDSSTDITIEENPYLYVSNVSVKSYDAAATRVYFYTNQKDVRVDPVGRIDNINGVAVNVKDKFMGLVTGDQDGVINFKYDAATQKGYFDLVNIIAYPTSAGGTIPSGDYTPILIRLRAGKLDHYVTVQPHITPYVAGNTPFNGTAPTGQQMYRSVFHKRSEKGERILTWFLPYRSQWTLKIESNIGTPDDLIIDRFASPDFNNNLLYSANPRDPEGANVDPNGVRSFTGRGRVYFRVGWKTTSPNTNRYARIEFVREPGAPKDYIFCRQGEEPDILIDGNTDKFAVYNLMGDGAFAQYPSQGGFVSQWGRPRMWPLVTVDKPDGYPTEIINEALDPDVAICPEGYTYPDNSTLTNYFSTNPGAPDNTKAIIGNGLCADGFFDRRNSGTDYRVDPATINISSVGLVISDPQLATGRSLFLPAPGYRDKDGKLQGIGLEKNPLIAGMIGGYWTGEEMTGADNYKAYGFTVHTAPLKLVVGTTEGYNIIPGIDKRQSMMVRCIKVENPVMLSFDANGGENAPRQATSKPNTYLYITRRIPINYFKPGYFFNGWNTSKNGSGTVVEPSSNYMMGTTNVKLYAQWDVYFNVNLRNTMVLTQQTAYLTANKYDGYTIASNGTTIATSVVTKGLAEVAKIEPAHDKIVFHKEIQQATDWTTAYTACKTLTDGGYSWRLPRIAELMMFAQQTIIPSWAQTDLFGSVSTPLWSGTEDGLGAAYDVMYYNSKSTAVTKSSTRQFRCVRDL